jgi:molybdopterin converting factor small subunit
MVLRSDGLTDEGDLVKLEVRLFADLATGSDGRSGDPFEVELVENATVDQLLQHLDLSSDAVHLVVINGRIITDRSTNFTAGDRVSLFPPVGGG